MGEAERNGDICFKTIEQRKPPEDRGNLLGDTIMGSAIAIWNRTNVSWLSIPMDVSGTLLNMMFDKLPRGSHVDLVIESADVREGVKMCGDIIVQGWDKTVYCQLDSWRRLMDTWKTRGSAMTIREFDDEGDDADCAFLRHAANREAWQAEKDTHLILG
jgi:hypothetical protein